MISCGTVLVVYRVSATHTAMMVHIIDYIAHLRSRKWKQKWNLSQWEYLRWDNTIGSNRNLQEKQILWRKQVKGTMWFFNFLHNKISAWKYHKISWRESFHEKSSLHASWIPAKHDQSCRSHFLRLRPFSLRARPDFSDSAQLTEGEARFLR